MTNESTCEFGQSVRNVSSISRKTCGESGARSREVSSRVCDTCRRCCLSYTEDRCYLLSSGRSPSQHQNLHIWGNVHPLLVGSLHQSPLAGTLRSPAVGNVHSIAGPRTQSRCAEKIAEKDEAAALLMLVSMSTIGKHDVPLGEKHPVKNNRQEFSRFFTLAQINLLILSLNIVDSQQQAIPTTSGPASH